MLETAGSPRVEGDEDEDGIDDLDNEFDYANLDSVGPYHSGEGTYGSYHNTGRGQSEVEPSPLGSEIPLLTYGEVVSDVLQHSLVDLVMLIVDFHNETCVMMRFRVVGL